MNYTYKFSPDLTHGYGEQYPSYPRDTALKPPQFTCNVDEDGYEICTCHVARQAAGQPSIEVARIVLRYEVCYDTYSLGGLELALAREFFANYADLNWLPA